MSTPPRPRLLRFLDWSAGDWAGRGVGVLLLFTGCGHLGVAWVLCATIYGWLGPGREWVAATGLYAAWAGTLAMWIGGRATCRRIEDQDGRIVAAMTALLCTVPTAWALWNLGPGWPEASPLRTWTFDNAADVMLLTIVVTTLATAAAAGIAAVLPGRSAIVPDRQIAWRRVAAMSALTLAPVFLLASGMPRDPAGEEPDVEARLRYRLTWADRWSRWIEDHDHCRWVAANGLIPSAREREVFGIDEPAQYVWEASGLLHTELPSALPYAPLLRRALEDPHYGADDRIEAVKLLQHHPALRARLLPTLVRLIESAEVSGIGANVGYPASPQERRELQLEYAGELKRAAADAHAAVIGQEPRIAVVPARLRPVQRIEPPDDPALAFPGWGFNGVVVGYSTAEEVLAALGDDRAEVTRYHNGDVMCIKYHGDPGAADYRGRFGSPSKPDIVWFEDGFVRDLQFGVFQTKVLAPGGIQHGTALDRVLAVLGNQYEHKTGRRLDVYAWPTQGIEVWVDRESEQVNSFKIVKRR